MHVDRPEDVTAPARRAALEAVGVELHACPETWTALAADVLEGLTTTTETAAEVVLRRRGSRALRRDHASCPSTTRRAGAAILATHAPEIAAATGADTLVELGSGSSTKTGSSSTGCVPHGTLRRYVPVDVSDSALEAAVPALARGYPGHRRSHARSSRLRARTSDAAAPEAAAGWSPSWAARSETSQPGRARATSSPRSGRLRPDDALLLGTDLVKDPRRLDAAYDDAAGVTADVQPQRACASSTASSTRDFDPDAFEHVARWNAERSGSRCGSAAGAPRPCGSTGSGSR